MGEPSGKKRSTRKVRRGGSADRRRQVDAVLFRPFDRIYSLRSEHVDLLRELDRLFPDRAPIVDFGRIPAGEESVEIVSRILHAELLGRFEQPVFMAFCHVNSERMLDTIDFLLEQGAYPLSRDSVLSDVYFRYYEHVRVPPGFGTLATRETTDRGTADSIFGLLCTTANSIVRERIDFLAACELPLPGIKLPDLDLGKSTLRVANEHLLTLGATISADVASHWVAHALLRMPAAQRRILYLREKLGLSLREIGERLEIEPFDVGIRLSRAWLELRDRVTRTMLAFRTPTTFAADTDETAPGEARTAAPGSRGASRSGETSGKTASQAMGRLLKLPGRKKHSRRRQLDDKKHETEGDADS